MYLHVTLKFSAVRVSLNRVGVSFSNFSEQYTSVTQAGLTALMNAVHGERCDAVTELVSVKADVDFQSKKNGNSALIEAVSRSLTDVLVELIRARANINLQKNV